MTQEEEQGAAEVYFCSCDMEERPMSTLSGETSPASPYYSSGGGDLVRGFVRGYACLSRPPAAW